MALKGTLKDFGIADILQLIGQQQKTGVLYIKDRGEEVEVSFVNGQVARALSKTRKRQELLGTMLVRAGMVEQEQLDSALDIQKRTLKRLGDILVTEGVLAVDELREMTRLQTTETLYKLFDWSRGNYEFIQQDVEPDPMQGSPIRPESILMEGVRRTDEWPLVREVVPSNNLSLERLKPLEELSSTSSTGLGDVDAAFDAAFSSPFDAGFDSSFDHPSFDSPSGSSFDPSFNPSASASRSSSSSNELGQSERLVMRLAEPGVLIDDLVARSRLGEFETCKAIANLIRAGYVKTVEPPPQEIRKRQGLISKELVQVVRRGLAQMAVGVVLVVLFAIAARAFGTAPRATSMQVRANDGTLQRVLSDSQLARLASALEVYRLTHGTYPDDLKAVVEAGTLTEDDLRHPYRTRYFYRKTDDGYSLLPPLE